MRTKLKSLVNKIRTGLSWRGRGTLPRATMGAVWCTLTLLLCGSAQAATLSLGTATTSVGASASLPLTLTPGTNQSVAAVQCDVTYPAALTLGSITIGAAASNAGKSLSTFVLGPGSVRLVLAGFNQTAIAAGVVATINVTVGAAGSLPVALSNAVLASPTGQSVAVTTANGGVNASATARHSADPNNDGKIALTELLRVIQLYNLGGYACATGTEDDFAPGTGDRTCTPHSGDYAPQDWKFQLSELLRLIQFFNAGGYVADATGEDGFKPIS